MKRFCCCVHIIFNLRVYLVLLLFFYKMWDEFSRLNPVVSRGTSVAAGNIFCLDRLFYMIYNAIDGILAIGDITVKPFFLSQSLSIFAVRIP